MRLTLTHELERLLLSESLVPQLREVGFTVGLVRLRVRVLAFSLTHAARSAHATTSATR